MKHWNGSGRYVRFGAGIGALSLACAFGASASQSGVGVAGAAIRPRDFDELWPAVFLRVAVLRAFLANGRLLDVRQGCGAGVGSAGMKSSSGANSAGESAHIGTNPDVERT
jgi:hypothetical protein